MKKKLYILLASITVFISLAVVLNIKVPTRKGVNYSWHTARIPLYLKLLDFYDRHYNYKQLAADIIKDARDDNERLMRLFEWTYQNIRKVPEGMPVLDDHVWHIIVRGYGASDQSCDVFSTLCNYAGLDAFYTTIYTTDRTDKITLSFVKVAGAWYIFDPYRGVYFKDDSGKLIDAESIRSNNIWLTGYIEKKPELDYGIYFNNIPPPIERMELRRSNIQSPLRRIMYEVKKWLKIK